MIVNVKRAYRFLFVSVPFSGIEVFFQKLLDLFKQEPGIESHWLRIEKEPKELIARIPPFSKNWTLKASAVARTRIRQLEKQHGAFDAALFNNIMPLTLLGEFRRRVPFGISTDCTPRLLEQEPFRRFFLGRAETRDGILHTIKHGFAERVYAEASFLLPYSSFARDSFTRDYHVDESKIEIVPVGVDVALWRRDSSMDAKPQRPSSLTILFIGGDFNRKGGDIMLRIAQRLEFHDCTFHFVTRENLEAVSANVRLHKDIEPNSRGLMQLYANADVFIMPTRAEFAQTNAILEAMAMELPVITTNIGGLDEVVIDEVTGFLLPPDDEQGLYARLLQLKVSPALRKRMGASGRQKAEREFDLAMSAEKILTHLKHAAARKHSVSRPTEQ